MRKFLPVVLSGAMALSFSQLAAAQSVGARVDGPANSGADVDINNTHQRGMQNSTQIGEGNQSSQVYGDGNQTTQQSGDSNVSTQQEGEQNQSAVGTGNQQSQQAGTGHSSEQDSTWSQKNAQNRQSGDAAAGGSADDDDDDKRKSNRGWHKGWENNKHKDPARSGSTRY